MRAIRPLVALCLGLSAVPAMADIYGYVDANGIEHFSTEQLDSRYRLFMKSGTAFDSKKSALLPSSARQSANVTYLSQHPGLKKYESLLHQAAQDFALDPALLKAVMAAESGFNPSAVSPKGAVGLMQLMPATAQRYGLQADRQQTLAQKLTDPKTNIRLGARYLRDLYRMFPGQPHLVVASYNAGEGAVQKYNNSIPPYPETRNYVQLVSQFYQLYKPASQRPTFVVADAAAPSKRIHMTIPARQNLPASVLQKYPELQ